MRVGLVRNVALGLVALVGLGLVGCDDNPTDFDNADTVGITTNPSKIILPAGLTTLLQSRTVNEGNEPTWEEITATVDGSCGGAAITVDVASSYEPSIQPPGQFDVTAGNTIGQTCIALAGGGANATVEVAVVGDSMIIVDPPAGDSIDLFDSADLSAVLLSDAGDPVSPFDAEADLAWSSDDEAVMTVDEASGVVTSTGVGAATITALWTEEGVEVSASRTLTTNAPTLSITNAPPASDSLLLGASIDLEAALTDPTDPPASFGPFDQNTDVTWFTTCTDDRDAGDCDDSAGDPAQDNGIITVDAATGEVTAIGPGTATVTAHWTPSRILDEDGAVANNPVVATADISVDIPAPTIASVTPNAGSFGEPITVTGAGFDPAAMDIIVAGNAIEAAYEPTIVNATTATFYLPYGDGDGEVSVQVGAPGQLSNALTVTRTINDETEEPNDDAANAADVAFPVDIWGTVDSVDGWDLIKFTLAAETTFSINLDWAGDSGDLDMVFTVTGTPGYGGPQCGYTTATGDHPEVGDCTLAAGTYYAWVYSYDQEIAVYHLQLTP
jgi:hypothetical protein